MGVAAPTALAPQPTGLAAPPTSPPLPPRDPAQPSSPTDRRPPSRRRRVKTSASPTAPDARRMAATRWNSSSPTASQRPSRSPSRRGGSPARCASTTPRPTPSPTPPPPWRSTTREFPCEAPAFRAKSMSRPVSTTATRDRKSRNFWRRGTRCPRRRNTSSAFASVPLSPTGRPTRSGSTPNTPA